MAVTKMEKVTLISDKRNQEALLKTIQGIQNVEIRDLFQEKTNNEWVDTYFPKATIFEKEPVLNALSSRIMQTREAVQFIDHHGDKQQKKQHLKRRELSLEELEADYSEEDFTKRLTEVLDLKKQWETLSEKREQLSEQEEWLTHWSNLDFTPQNFSSRQTTVVMGTISVANATEFREELAKVPEVYVEEISETDHFVYLTYVVLKTVAVAVEEIATRYGFVKETYPYERSPKEQLQQVKQELQACDEAQKN